MISFVEKNKRILLNMKKPIIQNLLDELSPFLISIEPDRNNSFKPIITMIIPINWELPNLLNNYKFECKDENDQYSELAFSIINDELLVDDLVNFIKKDIIKFNFVLEEKQRKLSEKIRKIEEEKEFEIEKLKKGYGKFIPSHHNIVAPTIPIIKQQLNNVPNEVIISEQPYNQEELITINNNIDDNAPSLNIVEQNFTEPIIIGGEDMSKYLGKTTQMSVKDLFNYGK